MVWAGITSEARTELVFVQNGSLTVHRYIAEVLEDKVMPFMVTMDEQGIRDNKIPDAAMIFSEYLDEIGFYAV